MANKRWNLEQLDRYVKSSGFSSNFEVDAVIKALRSLELIRDFFDTPTGGVLMSSVVDGIRSNMMKIIRLSVDGFDKNEAEIRHAALQINVAHEFMYGILTTMDRGEEIERNVGNA